MAITTLIDLVTDSEIAKYTLAFRDPAYRRACHGLDLWVGRPEQFPPIHSICNAIDYGCGTGRLIKAWASEGITAYGVDLVADTSVDPDILLAYRDYIRTADLVDFQILEHFQVGVCADVMEHLPTGSIPAALNRIAQCCDRIVFSITNAPSIHHGEPLHLTLEPPTWWERQMITHMGGHTTRFDVPPGPTRHQSFGITWTRTL